MIDQCGIISSMKIKNRGLVDYPSGSLVIVLRYKEDTDDAPKLIAKGRKVKAAVLKKTATDSDIPIEQNEKLVRELFSLNSGEFIPRSHYHPIAKMLAKINYDRNEQPNQNLDNSKKNEKRAFFSDSGENIDIKV
jgi:type III secretion system FlhB-like substrate exporter